MDILCSSPCLFRFGDGGPDFITGELECSGLDVFIVISLPRVGAMILIYYPLFILNFIKIQYSK